MENFKVKIEEEPYQVKGKQMNIGKFIMAKRNNKMRNEIAVEGGNNLDRDIQSEMYDQKSLNKWVILYDPSDKALVNQFSSTFNK